MKNHKNQSGTFATYVDMMGNEHDSTEKCGRVHHVNYETRRADGSLERAWSEYHAGPLAETYKRRDGEALASVTRKAMEAAAAEAAERQALAEMEDDGDELYFSAH